MKTNIKTNYKSKILVNGVKICNDTLLCKIEKYEKTIYNNIKVHMLLNTLKLDLL